jgi:hypothetical protein
MSSPPASGSTSDTIGSFEQKLHGPQIDPIAALRANLDRGEHCLDKQ